MFVTKQRKSFPLRLSLHSKKFGGNQPKQNNDDEWKEETETASVSQFSVSLEFYFGISVLVFYVMKCTQMLYT